MRRLILISAVAVLGAAAHPHLVAAADQQAQEQPAPAPKAITGKWSMMMEMSMGTATVALDFKQDGEKITGTYTGSYGEFPLEGILQARALEFAVYTTIEGQESTMNFSGEIAEDGESIVGSAILGQMGEAGWLAKRAK